MFAQLLALGLVAFEILDKVKNWVVLMLFYVLALSGSLYAVHEILVYQGDILSYRKALMDSRKEWWLTDPKRSKLARFFKFGDSMPIMNRYREYCLFALVAFLFLILYAGMRI